MNKHEREAREAKVVELRRKGATYAEIAHACGFKYTQEVYKILAKHGMVESVGGQRRKLTDSVKEAIIADRKAGLTYMQLSVKYQCSTVAINKVLRQAGLTGQ